jgi:CubicO group peptidase (beta-lactamase class C family)
VWEEGFGSANREREIRATPHTMYSLASISKPITATALMVLVERGLVDLDKPVNDYLGEEKITGYAGDASGATVRRIASHAAGLPLHYQFFLENESYLRPAMAETIKRYGILITRPGEKYQYSNIGYGILERVIERVSGKSYAAFLAEEVFNPLSLREMAVPTGSAEESGSPQPWAVRYWDRKTPLPFYDFDHRGASAVYSSAHDLVRFGMFHLGNRVDGQKRVLSRRMMQRMQRPESEREGGGSYGIGWAIDAKRNGVRAVSHTGGMGGVRTILLLVPEKKIAVAVLANSMTSLVEEITDDILAAMLPAYRRNLQQARAAKPDPTSGNSGSVENGLQPDELPSELHGVWTGYAQTYQALLPLQIVLQPSGAATAKLAEQPAAALDEVRFEHGFLTARFTADIGTPDANRRDYFLQFSLKLREDVLNGAATAISQPGPRLPNALTSWVELRREAR